MKQVEGVCSVVHEINAIADRYQTKECSCAWGWAAGVVDKFDRNLFAAKGIHLYKVAIIPVRRNEVVISGNREAEWVIEGSSLAQRISRAR